MANKRIKKWVWPIKTNIIKHEVVYPCGVKQQLELRPCRLDVVFEPWAIVRTLCCTRDGRFFVSKKGGWSEVMPDTSLLRRKRAGKPLSKGCGGNTDCPKMRHFGNVYCHRLVAYAWCRKPWYVTVNGKVYPAATDMNNGRMFYRLTEFPTGDTKDRVYMQVDHLNTDHGDFCADNLEFVTVEENQRRKRIADRLKKEGFDVKRMPYKLLRMLFKQDGMLELRIAALRNVQ